MRHTALVVLLCVSTSVLLFAQKGVSNSPPAETSRSAPSYTPLSHESSPSYTPPASSGGGSHSSNSGSSAGSGASSSRSSSVSHSPESNVKAGIGSSERRSSTDDTVHGESNLIRSATHAQTISVSRSATSSMLPLIPYSGNDFNKALKSGQLNPTLLEVGLEPNKKTYENSIASIDRSASSPVKNPNWFSRTFLGKQKTQPQPQLAMLPKPCPVKGCPPPPRPKPCVDKNCKPAPPPSPPGICHSGAPDGAGSCRPWGYLGACHRNGTCLVQFAPVDEAYCGSILRKIQQLQMQARSQQDACSATSQVQDCSALNSTNAEISRMKRQYLMCTMAAHIANPFSSSLQIGSTWP